MNILVKKRTLPLWSLDRFPFDLINVRDGKLYLTTYMGLKINWKFINKINKPFPLEFILALLILEKDSPGITEAVKKQIDVYRVFNWNLTNVYLNASQLFLSNSAYSLEQKRASLTWAPILRKTPKDVKVKYALISKLLIDKNAPSEIVDFILSIPLSEAANICDRCGMTVHSFYEPKLSQETFQKLDKVLKNVSAENYFAKTIVKSIYSYGYDITAFPNFTRILLELTENVSEEEELIPSSTDD